MQAWEPVHPHTVSHQSLPSSGFPMLAPGRDHSLMVPGANLPGFQCSPEMHRNDSITKQNMKLKIHFTTLHHLLQEKHIWNNNQHNISHFASLVAVLEKGNFLLPWGSSTVTSCPVLCLCFYHMNVNMFILKTDTLRKPTWRMMLQHLINLLLKCQMSLHGRQSQEKYWMWEGYWKTQLIGDDVLYFFIWLFY